jgi:hypothetical protein
MWFYGVDLMGHWGRFDLKGQWMQGHADGEPTQGVYGLDLNNGAYLSWTRCSRPRWVSSAAASSATRSSGSPTSAAVLTRSWRATFGLRWVLTPRAVAKAEYL